MAATNESETWKSTERAESKVTDERIQKRMLEVTRARRGGMRATTWKEQM
jgi:hypothetical protein